MIRIGTIIPGYCQGVFGRDSYEDKRVEAMGADWIVCRDSNGTIHFAAGDVGFGDKRNIIDFLDDYLTRLHAGGHESLTNTPLIKEKRKWCQHDDPSWCTDDCPKRNRDV